jgi:hypothetical protein
MRKLTVLATAALVAAASVATFTNGPRRIKEYLSGVQEVPVVSTTGHGTFQAEISADGQEIAYTLTFAELQGDIRQAHIHIAPPNNTGNIVLWLCQTATNVSPVASTPPCINPVDPLSARANTVTGVLRGSDIVASAAPNGVVAGELDEVIALMRAGKTYVNVHTSSFPPGEIRSQIHHGQHPER